MDDLIKKLNEIAQKIRNTNGKIKLIALLDKAKREYDQNKLSDCVSTCKKILKTDPNNATALRGLGCAMQSMGNIRKAI